MSEIAQTRPFRVSPHARRGGLRAGESRFGLFLLVPALVAFLAVVFTPFVKALGLSFTEYTLSTPEPIFVGLRNFAAALADPGIRGAFVTSAIYVVLTTSFSIVLGLGWALVVNQPFPGRGVVRSVSLLPWIMPSTVTAFLWAWIFNSRYGVLNALLLEFGLVEFPQAWLSTGAGNFALLRDHILPHLRPVLLVTVVLGMVGNLQQFDTIYALTGGGPVRATTVLSIEVYRRAFEQWDIGMAATVGVLWVATILPPAYFYLRQLMKGA